MLSFRQCPTPNIRPGLVLIIWWWWRNKQSLYWRSFYPLLTKDELTAKNVNCVQRISWLWCWYCISSFRRDMMETIQKNDPSIQYLLLPFMFIPVVLVYVYFVKLYAFVGSEDSYYITVYLVKSVTVSACAGIDCGLKLLIFTVQFSLVACNQLKQVVKKKWCLKVITIFRKSPQTNVPIQQCNPNNDLEDSVWKKDVYL